MNEVSGGARSPSWRHWKMLSWMLTVGVLLVSGSSAVVVPLTILDSATQLGAVCLDGTPPGYYWKQGTGNATKKWIVHQQGGGWCPNEENCLQRSKTRLGSSTYFAKNFSTQHTGFLSDDCQINPVFCEYNLLLMLYCDGGSFSGNRDEPIVVRGTKLFFRGKRILDAIFSEFQEHFDQAEEFILTGCSAGGLATYLHTDYPPTRLPKTTKYAALADAGYFIDALDQYGQPKVREMMQSVYKLQNASGGVNQKCISSTPAGEQWKCFFAQYTMPYIVSPIFALQSQYDYWQLRGVLSLNCTPPNCSSHEMQVFLAFRETFLAAFEPILSGCKSKHTGTFADSCVAHCQTFSSVYWDSYVVGGQRARETFANWYFNLPTGTGCAVDCAYPCNHNCSVHFPPNERDFPPSIIM